MKKNIEKILASAGLIIALVLIIILVVTAFGGIEQSEFDNQLVKGLIITLGVLYLLLGISSLIMLFMSNDAVREITLRSEQGGSCKVTLGVIRKLVKETFYGIEGVKTGKVTLIVNEYGVKLKVAVRVTDRDVFETETLLRSLLVDNFRGALGFKFHAIEFKIVSLQAKYKPDREKVKEEVAEIVADHTANYAALSGMVERSAVDGAEAPDAENTAPAAPVNETADDAPAELPETVAKTPAEDAEEGYAPAPVDETVEVEETEDAGYDEEEKSTEDEAAAEDEDAESEK